MLSQQDQEMRRNVPDPSFVGGSHFCGSGAGNETSLAVAGVTCEVTSKRRCHAGFAYVQEGHSWSQWLVEKMG